MTRSIPMDPQHNVIKGLHCTTHVRIQKVLSEGVQLWRIFLVDEGREDPNTTKNRPLSARQGNTI